MQFSEYGCGVNVMLIAVEACISLACQLVKEKKKKSNNNSFHIHWVVRYLFYIHLYFHILSWVSVCSVASFFSAIACVVCAAEQNRTNIYSDSKNAVKNSCIFFSGIINILLRD